MRHHNDEYLLSNIKIIEWHLTAKNGLQCTYEIDGITYHLLATPFRLTTLLSDVYLIDDRRVIAGILNVKFLGTWMPFSWYVSEVRLNMIDLVLICSQHEQTKAIVEEVSDIYIAARMKPLNWN